MKLFSSLLLSLFFITSCNGQNNTSPKHSLSDETKTISVGQTKLNFSTFRGHYDSVYGNVHCGLQDKAGNLWFGTTEAGVFRYDGKSFTNYTKNNGLNSNCVYSILEDKTGNIWVGTNAGLCRYDGKTFTGIPISVTNGNTFDSFTGKTPASFEAMLQDKTGKIWFATSNDGVYCYNGKSFIHFLHNDGVINKNDLHLNAVTSIKEDKNGNIWFTTWFEGLCRFDGKSITSFKPNGEVWFGAILVDKAGNIWVGRRDHGVCRYDGKTFTNVSQKGIFDSCCINAMAEDKAGNIWFGTEFGDMIGRETMGGVWCYDGKDFRNFTRKDRLSNMAVFSVTTDRSGKLWFGTRGMGLCTYDGKTFTDFSEHR